jgi:hypothetical protein
VVSTANNFNGADRGIREEWVPLFDRYGVDLVVCGHEHHYERSHPIRGQQPNDTLTPIPVATDLSTVDTTRGTEPGHPTGRSDHHDGDVLRRERSVRRPDPG